jgi:hypothetical protein
MTFLALSSRDEASGATHECDPIDPGSSEQPDPPRVLGGFATVESVAHGFRSGLRFLSLMMLTLGLAVALSLTWSARGLRAPPGSGYT